MPEALGSIGTALKSNLGTIIPGAMAGFGFLNNLINQRRYNRQQDLAYNLAKDPAAAARYIQGYERPLAAGLTEGVENQVQAALGERGLSQSPAISAAVYSQALAPYLQKQQQLAANEAMGILGAGTGFPRAPQSDVSGPLAELMKRFNPEGDPNDPTNTVSTNIGPPTLPYPNLDPFGVITNAEARTLPATTNIPNWSSIIGGFSPASFSGGFS